MKHLAKWSGKTITTAEKDGAVVIMDTENYIKNAEINKFKDTKILSHTENTQIK